MTDQYVEGFSSLTQEITCDHLPVTGTMPDWLAGSLLRNGPARFEVGKQGYRHWFDGLGMLHRFSFQAGKVSYANAFVQSPAYLKAKKSDKISYSEFATDPCRSIFKRITSLFVPTEPGVNANVNISKLGERFVAITETPLPIEFDPHTLATVGIIHYNDQVQGQHCTPHPHYDPQRRAGINSITNFGSKSSYQIYETPDGTDKRLLLGAIPVQEPAYIHSFSITEHYAILVAYPLVANPLQMLLFGKPFIENFRWKPELGTHFYIMRKDTGEIVNTLVGPAFFSFHHINAFERTNEIVVDICSVPNARIIDQLYLNNLREPKDGGIADPSFTRYHLPLQGSELTSEVITDEAIELPSINYGHFNGKDYQYAYGIGPCQHISDDFLDQLVKIDVRNKTAQTWHEEGCYPGEPIFVASPDAHEEDQGVILSVVLDGIRGHSFLLVLDAASFTELARAEVPHIIPFGFHGIYAHPEKKR